MERKEMEKLEKASYMDNSIQDQLERYISENLPLCLNNYNAFKEQGTIVEPAESSGQITTKGQITTNVVFTDEDVVINVNYPILLKKGEESKKQEKFNANIQKKRRGNKKTGKFQKKYKRKRKKNL